MDLSNDQWKILEPLIIEPNVREDGKGRPRMDARSILNGILWILRTGAQWKELAGSLSSISNNARITSYNVCYTKLFQNE
ncbi:transposase [Leptospira weilii]|uniref:Insertion element IS402-like domain-containing protein n=1 Tax=Leptospira weilii str. UI 13098 TaxID=1088542 RepID=M6Q6I4_9LEPT|nr:transposase [Leptospira weilii]EMN88313.1 hypothetical protein LEP1GSC108_1555 [Leptospira weilii str. UI 13098]